MTPEEFHKKYKLTVAGVGIEGSWADVSLITHKLNKDGELVRVEKDELTPQSGS